MFWPVLAVVCLKMLGKRKRNQMVMENHMSCIFMSLVESLVAFMFRNQPIGLGDRLSSFFGGGV